MALMTLIHCEGCGETFYGSVGLVGSHCGGSVIREATEAERDAWDVLVWEGDEILEGM